MGKPKDAKIWNEDLVRALDARHQKAQREGKRDVHLWRTGRDKILAVRKDIYMYRSGNIANLPNNLKKTVQRLCEDVIRGVKNVYPDGHVPTDQDREHPSTPLSSAARTTSVASGTNNPFYNDHYMNKITIRGGAFAILMAFRYSLTEILTKRDICREAQKFCDSEMESNFHAGRTRGAWKAKDTLKNRGFIKEQGFTTYTPNGFRDRPHTFSLTRDGELFIDALLANRPEAVDAARQAAGRDPRTPFAVGVAMGTPASNPFPGNFLSPVLSGGSNKLAYMETDRAELEEWLATASVGDRREFKVGKERRFRLHKLCDAMQRHQPGLLLTHGSSGVSRGRTMTIQLVSKPATAISTKVPHSFLKSEDYPEPTNSLESDTAARKKAGLAAIKRQEEAMEDIELRKAILESKKMTPQSGNNKYETPSDDTDKDLKWAIQASLRDSKRRAGVKRNIFATIDSGSSSSDIEFREPAFPSSLNRKKRKLTNPATDDQKLPAKKINREIFCIDSDSDKEDDILPLKPAAKRTVFAAKKPRAITSEELTKEAPTPSSINLCDSSDDELIVIQSLKEPIDLSDSQLSQDPEFTRESVEEPIDLSNSQLSQDPEFDNGSGNNIYDDEIIIMEDAAPRESSSNEKFSKRNNDGVALTVWIDNRERNRNATPRTLRNELTRHLLTGPLSNVWPRTLPSAKVEEAKLEWGDIQYSLQNGTSDSSSERLGVSIERKRVNDLVQRSSGGDHFEQLFRMKERCSLSILLIENDTRTACNVTPYNSQDKEGFDPFDPTIRSEDDVYQMFGRILLTCDSIKFIQTRDEQASLRSVGALGLMTVFAPSFCTKEREEGKDNYTKGIQALSDQLKEAGIPWKITKRISKVVGGPMELRALYDSCCNEFAKSHLLSHVIAADDQGDLKSSMTGWSDAIYRIIAGTSKKQSSDKTNISGEAALLLHKEFIEDHGMYLSTLYQGNSPDEALEKVLDNPSSKHIELAPRVVEISLTKEQSTKYFPPSGSAMSGEKTFYKLSILSDEESRSQFGAITMRTVSQSLASKSLEIFELEGSDIVDLVRDKWRAEKGKDFVSLAKTVARLMDNLCHGKGRATKRILMVCGLQPALDANAKKSGYATETKTVVDLVFAELLLCYDVTILQALRKKIDDRINLVKQLALSCFHCGFLTNQER